MNRLPIIRVVAMLGALGLAALSAATGSSREPIAESAAPDQPRTSVTTVRVTELRETATQVTARILVPTPQVDRSGRSRNPLRIRGGETLGEHGRPDVPVISKLVAIPECASVKVSAIGERPSIISDVDIPDFISEFPDLDVPRRPMLPSRRLSGGGFPGHLARIQDVGHLRGQRLALLELFPVQYDAGRREAVVYEDVSVTVTFESPCSDVHTNVGPMEAVLPSVVINPPANSPEISGPGSRMISAQGQVCWVADSTAADAAASVSSCGADYLIILADTLSHGDDSLKVQELADWRASYNGFNVAIVRVRSIIDYCAPDTGYCGPDTSETPVAIRDFIKTIYDDASAAHMGDRRLAYVLLIGDAFDPERNVLIPMYYGFDELFEVTSFACDGYYALMTDDDPSDDLFMDLFLGRLPVDADSAHWELSNAVDAILDYEPLAASSWADKVLLVSGGNDTYFTWEGQGLSGFEAFFDGIEADHIPSNRYVDQMHVLDPSYTDGRDFSRAVADSLRAGYGICALFDHGNYFYLAGKGGHGATLPVDFDSLATAKPPVVFAMGSHLGELDYTPDKVGKDIWGGGKGPCIPSLDPDSPCILEQREPMRAGSFVSTRKLLLLK